MEGGEKTLQSCYSEKHEDYVYVNGEYQDAMKKIKHYLRCENQVNKNKILWYYETLTYM